IRRLLLRCGLTHMRHGIRGVVTSRTLTIGGTLTSPAAASTPVFPTLTGPGTRAVVLARSGSSLRSFRARLVGRGLVLLTLCPVRLACRVLLTGRVIVPASTGLRWLAARLAVCAVLLCGVLGSMR